MYIEMVLSGVLIRITQFIVKPTMFQTPPVLKVTNHHRMNMIS